MHSNIRVYAGQLFKLTIAAALGYKASAEDIVQVMEKAMGRLLKDVGSVYSVQRASEILHGCIGTDTLDNHRINELMNTDRPLIFGSTPLYQALHETIKTFSNINYATDKTLLFVLFDGEPTDDFLSSVFVRLKHLEVIVDSLSDLLMFVSLDIYINQSTSGFQPKRQVGQTCYANASAAVLHLSMKRIIGRDDGCPSFNDLREEMINLHGKYGASVLKVLKGITPKCCLHHEVVDKTKTIIAIAAKRPVLAIFCLTKKKKTNGPSLASSLEETQLIS
ncbi:unnamed protein product [Mytilus coruscus]|uniref:Uncharacterized protein n=1 Tax=Mytilus coruscus TaxID=42192 RepID=A0A6J8B224_MYTCO|nr:unnamed protein product [Mytilus coruscus]